MSRRKPTKASPCSNIDLNRYDNAPYLQNPLLRFRIQDVREQRHYTILKNRAMAVSTNKYTVCAII